MDTTRLLSATVDVRSGVSDTIARDESEGYCDTTRAHPSLCEARTCLRAD